MKKLDKLTLLFGALILMIFALQPMTVPLSGGNIAAKPVAKTAPNSADTAQYLKTMGTNGTAGSGNNQFDYPAGIAINSSGDLYVCDSGNNRVQEPREQIPVNFMILQMLQLTVREMFLLPILLMNAYKFLMMRVIIFMKSAQEMFLIWDLMTYIFLKVLQLVLQITSMLPIITIIVFRYIIRMGPINLR